MPADKQPSPAPATPAGGKKRILIVEDERPLSHALELKLGHEGYETVVASTGTEGLKQAQSGGFDLILLDLILPEMDGFAILEALSKASAKVTVIVLSNLGQDEDRKRALGFGAKDYLVKSNAPLSDIVKIVKQLLGS